MPLTVILWNAAWRRPDSPSGSAIKAVLPREQPDLICLTESHCDFLDGSHQLDSTSDFGLGPGRTRRKVLLWSRRPWRRTDRIGSTRLPPGRYAEGETETDLGPLRVIGVCVPWSMAHVASGRRDRSPWDEHRAYLGGLAEVVGKDLDRPTLLLGDFNQTLSRTRAPPDAWRSLTGIFEKGFEVANGGHGAIDHCAIRGGWRVQETRLLENGAGGVAWSDHEGVAIRLTGG